MGELLRIVYLWSMENYPKTLTRTEIQDIVLNLRYKDKRVIRLVGGKRAVIDTETAWYRFLELSEEDLQQRVDTLEREIPDNSRWYWDGVKWHNIT